MSDLSAQIDLDSGPALDSIDALGTQLDQVVSSFSSGLGAALDVLSDIQIQTPDTTAVATALQGAVTDSGITDLVVPEPDTTAVTSGISDAVAQADATVVPTADTAPLQSDIEASLDSLDPPPINVDVTADTSDAQDAISSLGDSADAATGGSGGSSGGIAGLSFGLGDLTAKAKEAGSTSGEAAGEIGGIAGVSLPAVAGVAAIAGGIAELTKEGISAVGAQQRYNQVLGAFAAQVNEIHIAGFTGNLEDLAQAVGSTVPNLQNAATHIFTLGTSSGAAAPQVAQTTQQVAELAARAVALRPSLGDVGSVADRMSTILATGGRRAQQYGISLTSAQIAARALQIATADGRTEVTQFDKVAAGASITVATLGGHLGKDIANGSKNAEVQVKQLQSTFETALEKLGAPLVVPVLQTIKDIEPIAVQVFGVIGKIGEAFIPALEPGIKALGTVLTPVITALDTELTQLAPTIAQVGQSLAGVVTSTLPLFQGLAGVIKDLEPVTNFLFKGLAADLDAVSSAVSGTIGFFQTLAGFDKTADLGTNVANLQKAITEVGAAATKAGKEIDPLTAGIEKFVATSSRFEARNQVDDLGRLGLTYHALTKEVSDGTKGFADFVQQAENSGEISGIPQSTIDSFRRGDISLQDFAFTVQRLGKGNTDLVKSFEVTQSAVQKYSQSQIDAGVASGDFTAKQVKAAEAATTGGTKIIDYQKAYKTLQGAVDAAAISQANIITPTAAAGTTADTATTSWNSLATAIANNQIDSSTFDTVAADFGTTQAAITQYAAQITQAVQDLNTKGSAAVDSFGDSVQVAFGKVDPKQVIANLQAENAAILGFTGNLTAVVGEQYPAVAQKAIQEGDVIGGALLDAFQKSDKPTRDAMEAQLEAVQANQQGQTNTIALFTPQIVAALATQAHQSVAEYTKDFDLAHATDTAVQGIPPSITTGKQAADAINAGGFLGTGIAAKFGGEFVTGLNGQVVFISNAAKAAAQSGHDAAGGVFWGDVGDGAAGGIAGGLGTSKAIKQVEAAARALVNAAKTAAKVEASIFSPSRVFRDEVGLQMGLGVAEGIGLAGSAVAQASAALVDTAQSAALGAVSTTAFSSRSSGASSSTAGSNLVINVPVTLAPGMTKADGTAIGAAAAAEVVDTLSRRDIIASIRVS